MVVAFIKMLRFIIFILFATNLVISEEDVFDAPESMYSEEDELVSPPADIPYESPIPSNSDLIYLAEHFDDARNYPKGWVKSQAKKEGIAEDIAKYDGIWEIERPLKDGFNGDYGLVLKSKAKHAAIAASLTKPFVFNTKPLIVQYEVLLQEGQECGGAYIKLLSEGSQTKDLLQFHDKTPYTIMFGPDKCGNDHKLHFIFRHRNPLNGSIEEKHCKKPDERLEEYFSDKLPHLYTLIVNPDNTFEIRVDHQVVNKGSLLEHFTPPVNPTAEIDDPDDKKPDDWDEKEKIPAPDAVKPEDWDEDAPAQIVDEFATMPDGWLENEPTHIPDPGAKIPEDWDSDMDGEWEAPLIDNPNCIDAVGCGVWEKPLIKNPNYKGKWLPPLIDNPNYKGKWRPRRIPNPAFYEDNEPFKMHTVSAVGFELWSMSKDILFDNIIITDEISVAVQWAADSFDKKRQKIAKDSESFIQRLANLTNEYPLLWLVYMLILSIPIITILYFCCKPSSSTVQEREEEKAVTADPKKTDEITPDDIILEEPVAEDEEENDDKEKYSDKDEESDEDNKIEEIVRENEGEFPRKRKPRKE